MARIEYIGTKPSKEDNVAGSGVVWHGPGDVQEVPDNLVSRLLVHTGVWRRATVLGGLAGAGQLTGAAMSGSSPAINPEPTPDIAPQESQETQAAQPTASSQSGRFILDGPEGPVVLDAMDDEALRALSERLHTETEGAIKKADGRLKGDKLRGAILDAVKAANTQEA